LGYEIALTLLLKKDKIHLNIYGGKKKLEGDYFWTGVKGTMSFKKK